MYQNPEGFIEYSIITATSSGAGQNRTRVLFFFFVFFFWKTETGPLPPTPGGLGYPSLRPRGEGGIGKQVAFATYIRLLRC